MYNNGFNQETLVTNIFFRLGIRELVKSNIYSYYPYTITDADRPDTLAERYYGDPEYHWIIFLANDIIDPLMEWPKNDRDFYNYIVSKYSNIQYAKTNFHHYEKIITRSQNSLLQSNVVTIEVDLTEYNTLPDLSLTSWNLKTGETIEEKITRKAVTYYDYESMKNDNRRQIKLIKKDYLGQILSEFNNLTSNGNVFNRPGLRNLR